MNKIPNIKRVINSFKNGSELPENTTKEQKELAESILEAYNFVELYKKKNGNNSFLTQRLRDGYIGEEIKGPAGLVCFRSTRGKPYATIVAVKNKKGTITCAVSYMNPKDGSYPIIGQANALKLALELSEEKQEFTDETFFREKSHAQIKHFEKRALAYFYPEKYSFSRGTTPVENYSPEIQKRRLMILGEEGYNKNVCIPRTKEQLEMILKGEKGFKFD